MNEKRFILGELFCGAGGLALGAKLAGIHHGWATDYNTDACETYRRNFFPRSPQSVVQEDVRQLDYAQLESLSRINALAFGFPCNDFSLVGEQKGTAGEFGALYTYCVKAVRHFRPDFFVAENVSGLSGANSGEAFRAILSEFAESGYRLTPHLYRFEQYGVPQARHRIIIVGIREDLPFTFAVPSPSLYPFTDNTCRTAIECPPIPAGAFNNETTRQSDTVVERLRHILPGENAFNANLPEHLRLNVKGAKISQIYKRLDPARPAYTLTASGGGGTHVYHWQEPRALTNRERARLQTFPDDFAFCGSKESVRKQIGMAVPAQGAAVVFRAVADTFAGRRYAQTEANNGK